MSASNVAALTNGAAAISMGASQTMAGVNQIVTSTLEVDIKAGNGLAKLSEDVKAPAIHVPQ